MGKQSWKAGNMLNPVPAVMVSVADQNHRLNIITVAWAGTVCTNPPMVSISVRPSRYSYEIIEKTGFPLDVASAVEAAAPTARELLILRQEVDPQRLICHV